MVKIRTQEVLGRKEDTSMIAFYAAGIAVMFLLPGGLVTLPARLREIIIGRR